MLFERIGRIERHLDDPDAAFVDRLADRFRLVGRDAADDRDQRALVEIAVQQFASALIADPLRDFLTCPARKHCSPSSSIAVAAGLVDAPRRRAAVSSGRPITATCAAVGSDEADPHVGADQQAAGVGGGVLLLRLAEQDAARGPRTARPAAPRCRAVANAGRGTRRWASTSPCEQVGEDAVLLQAG